MRVLDTDVCVALLRGSEPLLEQLAATDSAVATTWMTAAELYFGAERSAAAVKNRRQVAKLLDSMLVLTGSERAARHFGVVKATLERQGQRLADADLIVASLCLAHDAVLVTGNLRHFDRVPGLQIETWLW